MALLRVVGFAPVPPVGGSDGKRPKAVASRNRIGAASQTSGRGRDVAGLGARPREVLTHSFPFQEDSEALACFPPPLLLAGFSSSRGVASGPATSVTVVDEVVVAGLLGDGRGGVGDLNVFQVQQAELDLHAEQRVQVIPRQLAHHVLPQQRVQPVRPDTVLVGEEGTGVTTDGTLKSSNNSSHLLITPHVPGSVLSALPPSLFIILQHLCKVGIPVIVSVL